MSRRERSFRDFDSRRHRSGFNRESSPKRYMRDGKQATEIVYSTTVRNQKHQHKHQDVLSLETLSVPNSKLESGVVRKDSDKKLNGHVIEENKGFSKPTDVPRSRSYFQHNERGKVGRSFGWRATTDRRQRDSKDYHHDSQKRDERSLAKRDNSDERKRPAFREKKIPVDCENVAKEALEQNKRSYSDRHLSFSERRAERDRYPRKYEKAVTNDRREAQRGRLLSRESQWGRERYSCNRAEKWKHDLFDEANKSPTKKNEEDQIARIEVLLSS